MVNIDDRKKLYDIIRDYYSGNMHNDDLDASFFKSEDKLVNEITRFLWYFYDDCKLHLWYDFFGDSTLAAISTFCYLLNTSTPWEQIELFWTKRKTAKDIFAINQGIKNNDHQLKQHDYMPFYPVCRSFLLQKRIAISKFYLRPFKRHIVLSSIKKLQKTIHLREIKYCRDIYKTMGYNYDEAQDILLNNLNYTSSLVAKILPNEDTIFLYSTKHLQIEIPKLIANNFTEKLVAEKLAN